MPNGQQQSNPTWDQQFPLPQNTPKPPGLGATLLGAVPIVGRGLYQHAINEYYSKLAQQHSGAVGNSNIEQDIAGYASNKDQRLGAEPDPDLMQEWQKLHGDVLLTLSKDPAKPLNSNKELSQRYQDLAAWTQRKQVARQAAVPSQIANMPPPPASFGPTAGGIPLNGPQSSPVQSGTLGLPGLKPAGAGPAESSPTAAQPTPVAVPQQGMEQTPQPGAGADPIANLRALSESAPPRVSGAIKKQLLDMQMGQAAASGRLQIVQQQLAASGRKLEDLPLEAQMDLLTGQPIRNLPAITPEQQIPSMGGGIIAQSTLPRLPIVPQGSNLVGVPPPANTPSAAVGNPAMKPPPGVSEQPTVLASTPPQLNPDEGRFLSAAQQVAAKYKLPFDPTKNPRNPLAQIPTRYQAEVNALAAEQKMDPESRATMLALRESTIQNRQFQQRMEQNRRADQSYKFQVAEMDKVSKPVDDSLLRLSRLQDTLNQQNPQADALVAPELLSFTSGGQGSGLRMNEAEISRIVGGRSNWENLKAAANKWRLDPKEARSITPAQDKQIRDLVEAMSQKLKAKRGILDDAYSKLISSDDPEEHKRIGTSARRAVSAIDQGQGAAQGGTATINTKAEYDALPSGAVYIDAQDGKQYRKK